MIRFFFLFLFFITSCRNDFHYQEYLERYDAESAAYLEMLEGHPFTATEKEALKGIVIVHGPDSLKIQQTKFILYLYTKTYNISYLDDTTYERREKFSEDILNWGF